MIVSTIQSKQKIRLKKLNNDEILLKQFIFVAVGETGVQRQVNNEILFIFRGMYK